MKLLPALAILAACACGLAATPSSAAPIYRYCVIGTPNMPSSCTYNTLEQCRMAATGGAGFCVESNFYVAARQAGQVPR